MINHSRLYEELVLKSWWTILFFLILFFAYDRAIKKCADEQEKLRSKCEMLLVKKRQALELQEELKRNLKSQDDDRWVELVLMQKLGLIPEGHTKVHFLKKQ